ncbi:MAG: hypothetical protein JWN04_6830, partial [Myxococcaceae bacterium]|nr:hypothetical protein [Myxococcaceae bacterium]
MNIEVCKRRLATLWFSVSGFLFVLVLAQSVSGKWGTQVKDAWSWLFPTILPTLSLIVGVLAADTSAKAEPRVV